MKSLVRWHWSFLVPAGVRELYTLWLANRRHRRNLEQIEIDEIDEIATTATDDDRAETLNPIDDNHATRRVAAGFLVATAERPALNGWLNGGMSTHQK